MGYLIFGSLVTASLALLPYCFRLAQKLDVANLNSVSLEELPAVAIGPPCALSYAFFIITTMERVFLSGLFLCVALMEMWRIFLSVSLVVQHSSAEEGMKLPLLPLVLSDPHVCVCVLGGLLLSGPVQSVCQHVYESLNEFSGLFAIQTVHFQ